MWFGLVTLLPDMFQALSHGVTGRAQKNHLLNLQYWNPRDYSLDSYKSVDDKPYGGGPGMLMLPEPLHAAISAAKDAAPQPPHVVYLSPQGQHFNQDKAVELLAKKAIILVSGRYEGIDQRIIDLDIDEELSVGDYIMTGGELPAMAIIDTVARLIPGVLGDENSVKEDSITSGLLKYPQYTRPEIFQGLKVPSVLLSGHHKQIEAWRREQATQKTHSRRPDLSQKKP